MKSVPDQDQHIHQASGRPLILAGRPAAREVRKQYATEIEGLLARYGILPGLAVVRVGDDPASVNYTQRIIEAFTSSGLGASVVALPANASRAQLQAELGRLSVLPEIAGVIVQMPLPSHLSLDTVIDMLDPAKDVDGMHPVNIGRLALGLDCFTPATPAGGLALLDHYGIEISGRSTLVIGRSDIVGKPFAQLMLARNATVTIAHSRTRNLPDLIRESEIVASATGKPGLIRGDMLRKGAVVVDFGAAMVDGEMVGDVDYESALSRAGAITPVPGGTGPMTNAMLLRNTIKAVRRYMGGMS